MPYTRPSTPNGRSSRLPASRFACTVLIDLRASSRRLVCFAVYASVFSPPSQNSLCRRRKTIIYALIFRYLALRAPVSTLLLVKFPRKPRVSKAQGFALCGCGSMKPVIFSLLHCLRGFWKMLVLSGVRITKNDNIWPRGCLCFLDIDLHPVSPTCPQYLGK